MVKTRTILWISSTILFTLSVVLEFTQVENSDWDDITIYSVIMMIVTLGLIALLALILSVIFFRKRKYKQRMLLTFPIATISISFLFLLVVLNHEYGLTDEYNYFSAKRDLRNGKVQIVGKGLLAPESKEEQAIRKQFGYEVVWGGCVIMNNGYEKYNAVMTDYLDKVNGNDWQIKQQRQLDSLRHSKHSK